MSEVGSALILDQDEVDKRSVAGNLGDYLPYDHLMEVCSEKYPKKKAFKELWIKIIELLHRGLEDQAQVSVLWSKKKKVILGIHRLNENCGPALVLGPSGASHSEANKFREFWGNDLCQLRRFEDGSIRESIMIDNKWGPTFIAPAIVKHLIEVHFKELEATINLCQINENFVGAEYHSRENVKRLRSVFSDLNNELTRLSDPSLPLRRVRGFGVALHCEGDLSGCVCPRIVSGKKKITYQKNNISLLAKDSNLCVGKINPVCVKLDVTHKKNMNIQMFNYLTTAYLINLKKKLEAMNIRCMIRNNLLYIVYKSVVFKIGVESPESQEVYLDETIDEENTIQSLFQQLGLRHSAWAGTCHLLRKWLDSKMMSSSIPESLVFLLLSKIFVHPLKGLTSPKSIETAILRFFDFISFHDFQNDPVIIDEDSSIPGEELLKLQRNMKEVRDSLPPMVIKTSSDRTPFICTRNVCASDTKRFINLCKQSLFELLKGSGEGLINWNHLSGIFKCDLSIFDIQINLKQLQIAKVKQSKTLKDLSEDKKKQDPFPINDFDPVECFLKELRQCYGHFARFYYGKSSSVIGVKLEQHVIDQTANESLKQSRGCYVVDGKLIANVEAMIADFKIIGYGLVKDIHCNIK